MELNDYEHPLPAQEDPVVEDSKATIWKKKLIKFSRFMGPAWVIACALLDPGAVEGVVGLDKLIFYF